jgi:hypothetical protein
MAEYEPRQQFQRALRALTEDEFDELYVRMRGYARHILSSLHGPLVRTMDPEDLIHHAYLRVETGASASGSAPTLFFHLANLMQRRAQKVAARSANTCAHLSIVEGDAPDDGGTINAEAFEAPPSDDPHERLVAAQRLRQILAYFTGKVALLRYINLRLEHPGATVAEYAVLLRVNVRDVRNMNRVLRRGFLALQEQR